jgi:hypothetical protein
MSTSSMSRARPSRPSLPSVILRLEGLAVLTVAAGYYAMQGFGWLLFVLLFLVPDLALVVFIFNRRAGALAYDIVHSYVLPLVLAAASFAIGYRLGLQLALIWLAHISMDRMVGYGLRYISTPNDTHLSRV